MKFPTSLRTIGQGAFAKCKSLRTAKLNEGLEVLGTDEYPMCDDMYHGVFERSALENVELPSTLKKIEYSAFQCCDNLRSIDLPDKLETIGMHCFSWSSLEKIVLPPNVKKVGLDAFRGCE